MKPSKIDPLKEKRNELISRRRNLLQITMTEDKHLDKHLVTGFVRDVKIEGKDISLRLTGVRSPVAEPVDPDLYEVFSERGLVDPNIYVRLGKNVYKFLD